MKLLLTSNGITNDELEKAFVDLTDNRKKLKIALIPTASDPIDWIQEDCPPFQYFPKIDKTRLVKNKRWHEKWKKEYEKKGHKPIIIDLKGNPNKIKKALEKVDVVDVSGGDGNYLLNWATESKLDTYLKKLLEKGVVYLGTSAGSNLITPSFGLGWWTPEWREDHVGFGIVDFCLAVHQKEGDERTSEKNIKENRKKIRKYIDFPWKVYLLKDGQAIKIDGKKVEHIGPGIKKVV